MITVYVWAKGEGSAASGHAAMDCGSAYISLWSGTGAAEPSWMSRAASKALGPRTLDVLQSIYGEGRGRGGRLEDDIRALGRAPDQRIDIEGLDEGRMISWWRGLAALAGAPGRATPAADWNGPTAVAMALRQGGGDAYSTAEIGRGTAWDAEDLRRYAAAIRQGLVAGR